FPRAQRRHWTPVHCPEPPPSLPNPSAQFSTTQMRKDSPLHSLAHSNRPLHFLCSSSPFAPKHRDAATIFTRKLFSERIFPEPPPPSDSSRKRLRHEVLKPPQPSLDDPKLLRATSSSSPTRR